MAPWPRLLMIWLRPIIMGIRYKIIIMLRVSNTVLLISFVLTLLLAGPVWAKESISLDPTAIDFPDTVVGEISDSQTVTVTNDSTGTSPEDVTIAKLTLSDADDFEVTQDNCTGVTIAFGETCTVDVAFSPTQRGVFNAHLNVYFSSTKFEFTKLSGQGLGPVVTLSASFINFGGQPVNISSSTHSLTVTNSGDADLEVTSVTVSSGFSIDSETCTSSTIVPVGSCTIAIIFTPDAEANFEGTLSIEDNAEDTPQEVTLAGVGVADPTPAISVSTHMNFGNQDINTTSGSLSVTLTNSGTAVLIITSITSSNLDFSESDDCPLSPTTIAIGGTCTITVSFTPTSTGTITGNIVIESDAINEPSISMEGVGINLDLSPNASLSTTELDFDIQLIGTSSEPHSITITNTGSSPLDVDSVLFSGDHPSSYFLTDTCSNTSVGIDKSCIIEVTFTPTVSGQLNASVVIIDDSEDSPQTVTLMGRGIDPTSLSGGGCQLMTQFNNVKPGYFFWMDLIVVWLFSIGLIGRIGPIYKD